MIVSVSCATAILSSQSPVCQSMAVNSETQGAADQKQVAIRIGEELGAVIANVRMVRSDSSSGAENVWASFASPTWKKSLVVCWADARLTFVRRKTSASISAT